MNERNGHHLISRGVLVAPEHQPKQLQAWNAQNSTISQLHSTQDGSMQSSLTGAIPRNQAHHRLPEDVTALAERENNKDRGELKDSKNAVTKTFHTLKDLFSSKFKKDSNDNSDDLNNVVTQQQYPDQSYLMLDQNELRSPFSALPIHMRQQQQLIQHSQSNIYNENNGMSPQHQLSFPSELGIRVASQPLLSFDKKESQVFVDNKERSESLANIDVTDSDDGGFARHAKRNQLLYSGNLPTKYHHQSPLPNTHSSVMNLRNSPHAFANGTNSTSNHPYLLNTPIHNGQYILPLPYHQQHQQAQNSSQVKQQVPQVKHPVFSYQAKQDISTNNSIQKTAQEPCISVQQNKTQHQLSETKETAKKTKIQPNKSESKLSSSAASSDYDKSGNHSSNVDSGRESAAYSSGPNRTNSSQTKTENSDTTRTKETNDSEWVDVVDNQLRCILEPGIHNLSIRPESTVSGSISSITPPLPPVSPDRSLRVDPKKIPNFSKVEYGTDKYNNPGKTAPIGPSRAGWPSSSIQKQAAARKGIPNHDQSLLKRHLFGLDNDQTSTTTRSLDLESMFGGPWCAAGQSVSDSETETQGLRHIRSQLEGLEHMYSEVLKMLGSRGNPNLCHINESSIRTKKRHGSISSLPSSSVSSRPIRDRRRADDRRKVRDIKGINKRFQRLESHVVTLARSVAHLSSEMRSQHLVMLELERLRDDLTSLRTQATRSQNIFGAKSIDPEPPNLTNPKRVKKLTNFFGEDPPLMRLFLKKLGYEKYAAAFESERVGMIELPYLGEERLQKLGVPLGPRLRILQEAQISLCKDTTLCIV